jgi:hypothetical protein
MMLGYKGTGGITNSSAASKKSREDGQSILL